MSGDDSEGAELERARREVAFDKAFGFGVESRLAELDVVENGRRVLADGFADEEEVRLR